MYYWLHILEWQQVIMVLYQVISRSFGLFSLFLFSVCLCLLAGSTGVAATSTKLAIEDSIGASIQVGFNYDITDNIGLNAAVWWMNIDADAEITAQTNIGTVKAKVDVEVDPYVYMLGAYYKF